MTRKSSNAIANIIQIGMRLPWWISLLSAAAIYLLLHHYAQTEIPQSTGPQNIAGPIIASVIKTGASFGQYAVPGLLLMGMLGGLITAGVRKISYGRVVADKSGARLDNLTWLQFERLVHQYFVERSFEVTESNEGPDGGVDLRLRKEGRTATVQCKHWQNRKVGVSVVREQFGVMTAEQADQCYVITSGSFTDEARQWAADKTIRLIDGSQLRYLLGHVDYDRAPVESSNSALNLSGCPKCGSAMVLRTAKRGAKIGSQFWGCSEYPRCRQTFDVSG
jgi:restriction system protein